MQIAFADIRFPRESGHKTKRYAFPSAAISRNRRQANQTPFASSSGADFSPSAVLTLTCASSTAHNPPIARPSNAVVISFQRIG